MKKFLPTLPKTMMSSLILPIACCTTLSVNADTLGVYGSWHTWMGVMRGEVGTPEAVEDFAAAGEIVPNFATRGFAEPVAQPGAWIALEHPVPFIPNIRLSYDTIDYWGQSTVELRYDSVPQPFDQDNDGIIEDGEFILWGAFDFITTSLEIDVKDLTLYWELMDNWAHVDLGFTIRHLDGEFEESAPPYVIPSFDLTSGDILSQRPGDAVRVTPVDIILPMIWTKFQFDVPGTGWFTSVTASGITDGEATMVDISGEIGYLFDVSMFAEVGVTLGARFAMLKADDLEGLYADADMSGFHGGLFFHF